MLTEEKPSLEGEESFLTKLHQSLLLHNGAISMFRWVFCHAGSLVGVI